MEKPELRQLLIETDVDKLVNIVSQKGRISIKVAAKKIGIKVSQVEEWAKVLEEHGLVKIVYPFIGEPRIELVTIPVDRKVREFGERRDQLMARTEQLSKKAEEVRREVRMSDESFKKMDEEMRDKLQDAEKRMAELKRLDELKKTVDVDINRWGQEGKHIVEKTSEIETNAKNLSEDITSMKDSVQRIDNEINRALTFCEQHGGKISNLEGEKKSIEYELTLLDKEIRLVSALSGHHVNFPIFGGLFKKNLKGSDKHIKEAKEQQEKLKQHAKDMHNKVMGKPPKPTKVKKKKPKKAEEAKKQPKQAPKPAPKPQKPKKGR